MVVTVRKIEVYSLTSGAINMRLKTVMSKIKAYTLIVGASSMRLETVVRKVKAYTLTLRATNRTTRGRRSTSHVSRCNKFRMSSDRQTNLPAPVELNQEDC